MGQVSHNGHQNVCKGVCVGGCIAKIRIQRIKFRLAFRLVAEYLDHLLSFDQLFNIAIDLTDFLLLFLEVCAALATDLGNDEQHQHQSQDHQDGQLPAIVNHHDEYAHHRNGGGNDLGHRIAEHFTDGVRIVGVVAHQISVGMGVKEPDGQMLHLVEHIRPDLVQRPGGNADHDPLIEVGAGGTD